MEQEKLQEVVNNIECGFTKLELLKATYVKDSLLHEWLEETTSYLSTALELCEDYIDE